MTPMLGKTLIHPTSPSTNGQGIQCSAPVDTPTVPLEHKGFP